MKKRTSLVCFLIFTLCVFYTAIPNTVFGQEEEASLAEQVIAKHGETLMRDQVQGGFLIVLGLLKENPSLADSLNPTTIEFVIDGTISLDTLIDRDTLTAEQAAALDQFLPLLEAGDAGVLALLRDPQVLEALKDPAAIDELTTLLEAPPDDGTTPPDDGTTPPDDGTTPPDDGTTPPDDGTTTMPVASLAEQVIAKHGETLMRDQVQGGFLIVLGLLKENPSLADSLNPTTIEFVIDGTISLDTLIDRDTLTAEQATALDQFLPLLAAGDAGVLALLRDPQVLEALKDPAAIDELTTLLAAPPDDGTTPTPDDGTTPTPDDGTTPTPDDGTTPTPDDGTTPTPDDGTTPTPDDGTTPTPDDGTTPTPDDGTTTPPPPIEQAVPFEPIVPTPANEAFLGKSKLGGLSINNISGRKFLANLVMTATGLSIQDLALLSGQAEKDLVEMVVQLIPKQVPFTKKQIRAFLQSDNNPIFSGQINESLAQGLDSENFGNAITPMPVELLYPDDPNLKYLTRDNLNLYVRVPSVNVGGVTFGSSDGTLQPKEGRRVSDPAVFGSETIPYTFRLEEALAATNLPAWPIENDIEPIFSEVTLRYSDELNPVGGYTEWPMTYNDGVWEAEIGVTQGNSFYYFEVTLATPVTLEVLDREKLEELLDAAVAGNLPSPSEVLKATLNPPLTIESWAMPDPRNLQLADRGILDALFNDRFRAALTIAMGPLLEKIRSGGSPTAQEISKALQKNQAKLQDILLANAGKVTTQFESAFDPMLSSVFSVPKVDPESESLWFASFDNIDDRRYSVGAVVYDKDGNPLDQMWSDVTVDTKAPEAGVEISAGNNTVVYKNDDDVYVATALEPGAANLTVTGMPGPGASNYVAEGYGYLIYQIIGLNPDGTPYLGEPSLQRPNTWMPLTPEATVLASTIWKQTIAQLVGQGVLPEELDLPPEAAAIGVPRKTKDLTLEVVRDRILPLLATPIGLGFIENSDLGPAIESLEGLLGVTLLDPKVMQWAAEVFGATETIINHIPITYGPDNEIMMLAQLDEDVLVGDYGIRAMGIDTLFNVSSHTAPTQLRIVDSSDPAHHDRASVTFAVIGDCNMDGDMDDLFESGPIGDVTIFGNTTENVMLTVTVDHRSAHPATVMVQYMDAAGAWQSIGELDLAGTEMGSTLTIPWNVADFDELIGAGSSVMVRAVATNALSLTDPNPTAGTINLDAGICPLDPEVIAITVDPATTTNSVSGAPQGMLTLNAYTPSRTSTEIDSVRLVAKGPQDAEWSIETSEVVEDIGGQALADLLGDLVSTVGPDKPTVNVDSTYRKWSVTIDTTTLADTITAGKDENQYVVTGSGYDASGTELLSPIDGVEAKFSVDNIDLTNITAVADADGAVEANEDGSYSVGGLVDKYDEAVESPMVTFTIKPVSYPGSYTSVMLVTDAEGVSMGEATETAEGSGVFEITVDVGILADGEYLENGTYMFHAVVVDAEGAEVPETDGAKISVNVENTYRPAPEILAITTDPAAETNPDSGAPKGTVTVNAYSIGETTSPRITSTRFEAKRLNDDDSMWKEVGTTEEGTAVSSEEVQELQQLNVDALTDLITVAAGTAAAESAKPSPIHRYQAYQKWTVDIDTVAMELPDTIDKDSPAARDVSKDDNPYIVRAVAISAANESETGAPDGVNSTFSLDNVDDVAPLGPTNIVAVADVAGPIEANEDGSYTVGGIVDDTVPSPIATFTVEPTADPATYASVNLVQTTEDGTETVTEGEAGMLDITIDVGLLENGTYMFHALAVDDADPPNVQTDESPMITVHVLNFRVSDVTDIAVIAVDGTDVAEAPAEPIPLRGSVTVSFMVANGSLAAEELSGAVDGSEMPSESAEDPENTFSLKVEVGALADGVYTPDGVVTKRNGSVAFPITTVNVDNTGPMVTIESPTEDETVESLPTVRATYHDGAGAGVDGATGSLALARLQPPDEVEIVVDQADLDKDAASLVYTRSEPLAGGAYRVTVQVADNLGNVGEGSAEFVVTGTAPMVAIQSPASGQTFEHGEPLISGEFSGAGTVEVTTFTINDVAATPEVDGNRFSYTPEEGLGDGNHTVVVAVTDGDGNTVQTSVTFTVEMPKDTTPPVISAAAPNGVIKDADHDKVGSAKISAVVTDEQSAVSSVKYSINGGQLRSIAKSNIVGGKIEAPIDFAAHGPGLYNVRLVATSEGGTTEYTWSFTLIVDNVKPVITSITPSGTIRGGLPVISASANDESGVSKMTITVWDSAGKEVKGKAANDSGKDVEGITRVDFNLEEPLDEGLYTIEVRATDPYENSASAKGTFTIDFDTAAPVITMASPQNEARLTNRRPLISITYADAESGVDVDSIRFIFNSNVINLKPNQKTASQVLYRPEADLPFGQHTVKLEVSDMAHKEGNVSEKNKGAREANMATYEFTFFVESVEGPILVARPINVPNPFKDDTYISFALTRQSVVSIAIYDSTLRPVRVLMDNKVMDAGNYFGKDGGILWNGKSSGDEEDLARGIYFCQIIVGDGIEPEYAILKLALTR